MTDPSASLANARNRLRMAEERQGRAETMEEWLADQRTIEQAQADIRRISAVAAKDSA